MVCKWSTTLIFCFLAFTPNSVRSAELQLTPAQEAKANEIGAVASPVAFLSLCNEMTRDLTAAEMQELESSPDTDKDLFAGLRAISAQFCAGMITAVAQTVATDPHYLGPAKNRTCVDPRQSVEGVLIQMNTIAKEEPQVFHNPQVTTPAFILYALQRLSDCSSH